MTLTESTKIEVKLPLALDVVRTLTEAIEAAYPGASILADSPVSSTITFVIPEADRRREGGEIAVEATPAAPKDAEGFLTSMRDGSFEIAPPEWFSRVMVSMAGDILDADDVENYVELQLAGKVNGERRSYVVIVARSHGQTPHELRKDAEARAERYKARLTRVRTRGPSRP